MISLHYTLAVFLKSMPCRQVELPIGRLVKYFCESPSKAWPCFLYHSIIVFVSPVFPFVIVIAPGAKHALQQIPNDIPFVLKKWKCH